MNSKTRPRLLVISQVYAPDPAAVGQYVTDACEEMVAQGWEVVVYTSARGYDDPSQTYPARETRRGVSVRRLPLSSFGKHSIAIRLAAQLLFVIQAMVHAVFAGRFTALLVSTSPPFAGFCGALLSIIKCVPMTWWVMDLNPDQMIAAGKLSKRSVLARVFDWMNRVTIYRARKIVVLDRFMKDRVVAKTPGVSETATKIEIIPPWSLDTHLAASAEDIAAFRTKHGLSGKFVVMYAGNHSEQNPLTTLLDATERVSDIAGIRFVFVGGGAGKSEVERRIAAGAANLVSLPYQPLERLAATLGAADVHVVSVGDPMVGIVHPCKIYSAMAIGRPILLFGPNPCHASEILATHGVGWQVAHGDVSAAEAMIRAVASASTETIQAAGARGKSIAQSEFSRASLLEAFVAALGMHEVTPLSKESQGGTKASSKRL